MLSVRKMERGPGSLVVAELPVPVPGPGQVVLKVAACGVCGSDLHAYRQDPGYEFVAPPVTLGHEYAGWVHSVGPGVQGWAPGQAACVIGIQACGACLACRDGQEHLCMDRKVQGLHYDGGMAQYAVVGARFLVPLPDGIDPVAAALVEPLSVALHAVFDRADILPGDRVLVTGPGVIGLLCAVAARLRGGLVTVAGAAADEPVRLPVARELGFATAVGGLAAKVDLVIEASGAAPALEGALSAVRRGGSITVVGLYAKPASLFMTTAAREELTIRGSYASSYPHYLRALDLIGQGLIPLDRLVQSYPLSDARAAFDDALSQRSIKPVLLPWTGVQA